MKFPMYTLDTQDVNYYKIRRGVGKVAFVIVTSQTTPNIIEITNIFHAYNNNCNNISVWTTIVDWDQIYKLLETIHCLFHIFFQLSTLQPSTLFNPQLFSTLNSSQPSTLLNPQLFSTLNSSQPSTLLNPQLFSTLNSSQPSTLFNYSKQFSNWKRRRE